MGSKHKHKDETREERRERKRLKREAKAARHIKVEDEGGHSVSSATSLAIKKDIEDEQVKSMPPEDNATVRLKRDLKNDEKGSSDIPGSKASIKRDIVEEKIESDFLPEHEAVSTQSPIKKDDTISGIHPVSLVPTKRTKKERPRSRSKHYDPPSANDLVPASEVLPLLPDNTIDTSFTEKQLQLTISLLPASAFRDTSRHLSNAIRRLLYKYGYGVDGILLAFDNLRILNDGHGVIFNELPHIHFRVTCDALVFRPVCGSVLTGVVTESSFPSHLSLVVLHYFNASIAAEEMRTAGFEWNHDGTSVWQSNDTAVVSVGDKVNFRVKQVNESAGIISIEGICPQLKRE